MDYTVKEPLWQFIDHWQTLITGLLALIAGIGTVWATISAAKREISAAQEQTRVAQEQIATTLRIEQQRNAREAWAFYVALEAAMRVTIDDVAAARAIFRGPDDNSASVLAYDARQRITKSMFPELRAGLLRLGGQLAAPLVSLDSKIDSFAAQWMPAQAISGLAFRNGRHAGLTQELDQIEIEATSLCDEAGAAINRCRDELVRLTDP